jgi:hypothetical protein
MNYLRRIVVPYAERDKAYIALNTLRGPVHADNVLINKLPYTVFKAMGIAPIILQKDIVTMARNGTIPLEEVIRRAIIASDLDIGGTVLVDASDLAAVTEETAGDYAVTCTATDPWDGTSTIEFIVRVIDATIALITLTATAIDIEDQNVAAFDPTANIASAVDDTDDVSASVLLTFKEDDAAGADIFDTDYAGSLALAKTHLGTETNKVFVMYNYSDASGNPAVEKTATWTAIADT